MYFSGHSGGRAEVAFAAFIEDFVVLLIFNIEQETKIDSKFRIDDKQEIFYRAEKTQFKGFYYNMAEFFKTVFDPKPSSPDRLTRSFDFEPADTQLADFTKPEDTSIFLKVSENPNKIVAGPGTIPMWFATVCTILPAAFIIYSATSGKLFTISSFLEKVFVDTLSILSFFGVLTFVYFLNRSIRMNGDYLIYNKIDRTLFLPRVNITLDRDQIHSFIYLYVKGDMLSELSVLVTNPNRFLRYSVLIEADHKKVKKLAEQLSEVFNVPLKSLEAEKKQAVNNS